MALTLYLQLQSLIKDTAHYFFSMKSEKSLLQISLRYCDIVSTPIHYCYSRHIEIHYIQRYINAGVGVCL